MAFDAFLKIDGIPGESQDRRHKDEIEILSFSWGVSQTGTPSTGGGGGAGKATFQDFHFVSRVQKSSPKLFLACASGQHLKEAVLSVRRAASSGRSEDFYTVTLSDLLVSSFQQGGTGDSTDSSPMDQISMNYAKIRIDYAVQDPRGALGDHFVAGWDQHQNKGA